jgi:acyl carrier protein
MKKFTQAQFEQDLLDFLSKITAKKSSKPLTKRTELFDEGVLESLNILDVIYFVEKRLKMKISDDQVVFQNFKTVADISKKFGNYEKE